jgi:hypothetical protein
MLKKFLSVSFYSQRESHGTPKKKVRANEKPLQKFSRQSCANLISWRQENKQKPLKAPNFA